MSTKVFDPDQTEAYYDGAAISEFYQQCWGGEDIHIGLYSSGRESVGDASAAMTRYLIARAAISEGHQVLDIACGYGGTLRTLARKGCQVKGIDISDHCVERCRILNNAAGLDGRIDIASGDFHHIDSDPNSWDAVICQEAIIHSNDRPRVFAEVFRVLRPGGVFVFSDILTGEQADISMVEAAFARLGAKPGATISDYRAMAQSAGFTKIDAEERPADIKTHYNKLAAELSSPINGLSADAQAAIVNSISRWQAALAEGHITWASFVTRKPA